LKKTSFKGLLSDPKTYFVNRLRNLPIEVINNKAKLIKRTGFSSTSYANINGKYPTYFQNDLRFLMDAKLEAYG